MAIQCQVNGLALQYSAVIIVQRLRWWRFDGFGHVTATLKWKGCELGAEYFKYISFFEYITWSQNIKCFAELPKNGFKNFDFSIAQMSISILVNHTLAKTKSALPLAALSVPPGVVGGDILPLANRGSAFSCAPDNTTLFLVNNTSFAPFK